MLLQVEIIRVGETLVGHPFAMAADLKKNLMRLRADSIVSLSHPSQIQTLSCVSLTETGNCTFLSL